MKKRWISILLLVALLLSLAGCSEGAPVSVEDTFENAIVWGNTRAAEQGDYLAMRSENNGAPALILYNKKTEKADVLVEDDVYHIGFGGNRIFFKTVGTDRLYCYELETKKIKTVDPSVYSYQVWNNTLYFINGEHGNYYYTVDLETMAKTQVETGYTVDRLYLTDYGVYYYDDTRDILMVSPHREQLERLVYHCVNATMQSVISMGGANVMMLVASDQDESATLISYHAAQNKTVRHLTGSFSHFNFTNGYAVTVNSKNHTVFAVDPAAEKNYTVCGVGEYENVQIMSDCVILYNGNRSEIQYFNIGDQDHA